MTCRICLENGGDRFCKCDGTSALIHENCLLKWMQVSNKTQCEICHTPYTFVEMKVFKPTCYDSFSPSKDWNTNIIIFIPSFLIVMVTTTCEIILNEFVLGVITTNIALLILLMITFDEAKSSCVGSMVSLFSLTCLALQRHNTRDFNIALIIQSVISGIFIFFWIINCACLYNFKTIVTIERYGRHGV